MPPNGAAGLDTRPVFRPTMPTSKPFADPQRSVEIAGEDVADEAPFGVVPRGAYHLVLVVEGRGSRRTGPKISFWSSRLSAATSASTVGG